MATTFYQVKNNVGSTVTGTYAPGSGTLTLADASGFPASYPYRVSTFGADGTPKSILRITGRTGNVLTVAGAIDGTTDVVLSIGDLVRMRVAAGALADIHTAVNAVETTVASYGDVVTHPASDFATASAFTAHTANTSNPHAVTAAQTGAYTTAQVDTLLAAKQAAGSYVPTTTTVAGHPLSSNVTITPGDIGAQAAGSYLTGTLVTTVGNPGSNGNVPSEAAVRSAIAGAGGGTVSSVGLTMPTGFSVANSPVTTTGTLAVTTSLSGFVKASGGAFTAGSIAAGDLPDTYVPTSRLVAGHALTGNVTVTASDVGLGSVTNDAQLKASQLVTTVGSPGLDTNVPSEKAVRTAIGAGGGGGTPGGSSSQVQYNSSGAFAGAANLAYSSGTTTVKADTDTTGLSFVDGSGLEIGGVKNVTVGAQVTGFLDICNVRLKPYNSVVPALQIWYDMSPTTALAIGNSVPGTSTTSSFYVSAYNGFSWAELWHSDNHSDTTGAHIVVPIQASGRRGLLIAAASGQTANLVEYCDNGGTPFSVIRKDGSWKPPALADSAAANDSIYYSTTASKLVYKGPDGTVNNLY